MTASGGGTTIWSAILKMDTSELGEAGDTVDGLKDKFNDMASSIPGVGQAMGAIGNASKLAGQALEAFGGGLIGIGAAAAVAIAALGAVGIGLAFHFDDQLVQLNAMAAAFGITADQASLLSKAAQDAGGSLQTAVMAAERVSQAMYRATSTTSGTEAAFSTLGVHITDANGQFLSNDQVLSQLIDKYNEGNLTVADHAALMAILGRNYEQQIPVIEAVLQTNRVVNEQYQQGIGITTAAIAASKAHAEANIALTGVMNQMGSELVELVIPAVTSLTNWFIKSYEQGGFVAKAFVVLAGATQFLIDLFTAFVELGDVVGLVFETIGKAVSGTATTIVEFIKDGPKAAAAAFHAMTQSIGTDLQNFQTQLDAAGKKSDDAWNKIDKMWNAKKGIGVTSDQLQKPKANPLDQGDAGGTAETNTGEQAIERLIASLQKQTMAQQQLNEVQKITQELQDKTYDGASKTSRALALQTAAQVDQETTTKDLNKDQQSLTMETQRFAEQLGLSTNKTQMDRFEKERLAEIEKINLQTEKDENDLREHGLLSIDAENRLLADKQAAIAKVDASIKQAKADEDNWLGRGVQQYITNIGNMNEQLTKLVSGSLQSFSSALTDMFTGKGLDSMKQWFVTLLDNIANMIIQTTILIPLLKEMKSWGSTSGISGWITSMLGGSKGAGTAMGDVFDNGNMGLNPAGGDDGEAGPEAELPLSKNSAGQLGVLINGAATGNTTFVSAPTIHLVVNGDAQSKDTHEKMARMLVATMDHHWNELNQAANRPGGANNSRSLQY